MDLIRHTTAEGFLVSAGDVLIYYFLQGEFYLSSLKMSNHKGHKNTNLIIPYGMFTVWHYYGWVTIMASSDSPYNLIHPLNIYAALILSQTWMEAFKYILIPINY